MMVNHKDNTKIFAEYLTERITAKLIKFLPKKVKACNEKLLDVPQNTQK